MVSGRNVPRSLTSNLLLLLLAAAVLVSAALAQEGGRKIKSKVQPTYPTLASQMHITGVVKLQVTIAANGTVKSTKVVGGHPLLSVACEEAVKKWKYEPAAGESTEAVECDFHPSNQ